VSIPLLTYSPSSQNQRVANFEVFGEEKSRIYTTDNVPSTAEVEEFIWAAYRQIFSEHQILKSNRQGILESQLKNGQITVRDFIRGLATSATFLRLNYEPNSNYRFVELVVQRVLGRDVYSEREKIAWSIVVVNKGPQGFVNDLLDSDEYYSNFGDNTVPYQRRRILPQQAKGETPFNLKTPRYNDYHRAQLGFPQIIWQNEVRRFVPQEKQATPGNPSLFLKLAQELNPKGNPVPRVSAQNIDIEATVPYRRR
jgi:phycobilisome rod-core linker protein